MKNLSKNKRIDSLLVSLGLDPKAFNPETENISAEVAAPRTRVVKIGTCGKHLYPSECKAREAAKHRKSIGANTSFLRPYFCDECKGWHLTSLKTAHSLRPAARRSRQNAFRPADQPTPWN